MLPTRTARFAFLLGLLVGLASAGCREGKARPTPAPGPGSTNPAARTAIAPLSSAAPAPATTSGVAAAPVPQAGPGGLSGPPVRPLPAPTRPITVGPGPVVGATARGDVFEHLRDWTLADLRALDPIDARLAGDGLRDARELVAFYSRREAGDLFLRVDLLDLRYGAELGGLDLVFLVGWGSGQGATRLPLGLRETTAHPWDLALVIRDTQDVQLLDAALAPISTATVGAPRVSFRSDLDAVEASVPEAALQAVGWAGQDLVFQVLSVKDGEDRVADAVLELDLNDRRLDQAVLEGWVADRRAVVAPVAVANRAALKADVLNDLIWSQRTRTSEGLPTGLRRTLESHTAHGLPLSIRLTGQLMGAIGWASSADPLQDGPAFLRRTAQLWDGDPATGEGAYLPGTYSDAIMPYFEGAPNARFAALGAGVARDWLGAQAPGRVFWIPERVASGATLAEVTALGYTHTVLDRTHFETWTGQHPTDGRLRRINGVTCFVIDPTRSLFSQADGGPDLGLRTLLLERALDPDPHQALVVVADWEEYAGHKGNPDVPDVYDRVLAWLSQRPWIEVATLEDLAGRGWAAVDHGQRASLPIETHEWLRHACQESYDHWYYGHPLEESFAGLRPVVRHGRPFPRVMGDVKTPGTLLGDLWVQVQAAPAGELRELAELALASAMYRTAWHQEDMHDTTRLASGAYLHPDTTYDRLTGFAHALSTHVGDAAVVAYAAGWAASPPAQPRTEVRDVDLDGEPEYLLMDDRLLLVVEREGGRVVAGFARDPQTGQGHQVIGSPLAFPEQSPEAGWESPAADAARTSTLKDVWATGPGRDYVNDDSIAVVSTTSVALTFRSSDGLVSKTIAWAGPGRVEVTYALDPQVGTLYVRAGLSPDLRALAHGGQQGLQATDQGGVFRLGKTVGARTVSVALDHRGRRNPLAGDGTPASPRTTAYQHVVELSGDAPGFSFGLGVEVR